MAMHETCAPVGSSVDLRMTSQGIHHLSDVPVRRLEQRDRRSLPGQNADIDPLRQLGKQVAHDHRVLLARQLQLR